MQQSGVIKILVADDHPILRRTLSNYLAQEAEIQIVGEAGDTGNLVELTGQLQPDILLLDANMPGPNVAASVKALKNHHPEVQILVLTASKSSEQVLELLKAGVDGYVLKEDSPRELLQAITTVAGGREWFSPRIAPVMASSIRLQKKKEQVDLTERETDVLRLMVTGINNDEIAQQLFIATNTVKNHVRSIFRKLGVNTRVEAVVFALDHHLVDQSEWDKM